MNEEQLLKAIGQMMDKKLDPIKEDITELKDRTSRMESTIENTILPAIDALVEGQDLTHQMIRDLATKDETEELRQEVRILKTAVAAHSREIEELKKAQ